MHDSQCMCGGGQEFHKTERMLRSFEAEREATLKYVRDSLENPYTPLSYRMKLYKQAVRLSLDVEEPRIGL